MLVNQVGLTWVRYPLLKKERKSNIRKIEESDKLNIDLNLSQNKSDYYNYSNNKENKNDEKGQS